MNGFLWKSYFVSRKWEEVIVAKLTLNKFPMLRIKKITKEYENMKKNSTRKKLSTLMESSLSKKLLRNVVSTNNCYKKKMEGPLHLTPSLSFCEMEDKGKSSLKSDSTTRHYHVLIRTWTTHLIDYLLCWYLSRTFWIAFGVWESMKTNPLSASNRIGIKAL